MLDCRICGKNPISRPDGCTEHTRFTCKFCTARIWRHRNEVRIRRDVDGPESYPSFDPGVSDQASSKLIA